MAILVLLALALCSSWHFAFAVRLENIDETVKVRLLLTRHAFSCANAADQFGKDVFEQKKHVYMKDPMLTNCGVHRSKEGAEKLSNIPGFHVDLVLASSMLRAMETAAFMYPNHTIVPCPYISEEGFGEDNKPRDVQDQLKNLKTSEVIERRGLSADRLDLQWMESGPFSGAPRKEPSWPNFKKFLADVFLPSLPAHLRKKDLTIAVVTHSHFLKVIPEVMSNCKSYYTDKPKNNQVLEVKYHFTTKLVLRKTSGSELIPPKFIDPYSTASDTWLEVKALLANENHTETVFGNVLTPKLPPWTNLHGVNLHIERDFEFEPDSGCINLIDVPDKDKYICDTDYGKVCEAQHSKKPKLKFVERVRTETEAKLEKSKRKGRMNDAAKAQEQLDELENFVCCAS